MKKTLSALLLALGMIAFTYDAEAQTPQSRNIEDVIMARRSIRKYTDQRIDRKVLDKIMELGINAPNGQNRQAYEVRVVDDPALVKQISDAATSNNPNAAKRPGFKNIFVNAPCVVFIAADKSYDMSQVDCGLLAENIMLAAWAEGIGSCCLGGPVRTIKNEPACKPYLDKLGFSEGYDLLICVGLGYADEAPAAKPRKAEKVMFVEW
ncbi:MAG: nitroreductase [Bacteroidales bacterium]|nr:nitroreductase [Candidatus Cryptobacteroides caccocaballi]